MQTIRDIMEEERLNRIEIFKEIFSDRLKELRAERKWTQKTVARKLSCPVSTYANWEQGRTEPSIYDIFNIMWTFEIGANELFDINHLI